MSQSKPGGNLIIGPIVHDYLVNMRLHAETRPILLSYMQASDWSRWIIWPEFRYLIGQLVGGSWQGWGHPPSDSWSMSYVSGRKSGQARENGPSLEGAWATWQDDNTRHAPRLWPEGEQDQVFQDVWWNMSLRESQEKDESVLREKIEDLSYKDKNWGLKRTFH